MHRIGLALSGGGFRATLYHLGMIRFLREANILPAVTHITSVSGGSILAAHLVLNWHRYTDTLKEFDAAAAELIRFVQLDIRNRVVRRYPLMMPLRVLRQMTFQQRNRHLTRTGLLEYHYEKLLYGDTCLFQLPERPRLSILATNLSEGCLCAFTREGLIMQRRLPGQRFRFERIHTGLATLPMAVTASSAFPGFFPPLVLQGQDVGADPGQFGRFAFTDGGVYDNLGVRMFRWMERSWLAREVRLQRDDFFDADQMSHILQTAAQASEDTPLRRLAQMLTRPYGRTARWAASGDQSVDRLLDGLWDVMSCENLAREPAFAGLAVTDPDVESLRDAARHSGSEIEAGEQLWLNRQLVDAAFRQATGQPCFRSPNVCFDGVLVSDAGSRFKIHNTRGGGLIATSIRATDIVMDRVWQLETDTFVGTPGFVFAPISRVIQPDEDPTAAHPEVQRMAAGIRTDLDRFSPLECSVLIRQGYCVGRSACRARPDLFGTTIPAGDPWDPLATGSEKALPAAAAALRTFANRFSHPTATPETKQSRALQKSAKRRLWSTLLDYRDWTSFLYVPLLVPILVIAPYYIAKWYQQTQVAQQLVEGIAQSNSDYALISKLLQDGPLTPFKGVPMEEVRELTLPDSSGIEVIADTRVIDMRSWKSGSRQAAENPPWFFGYRRVRLEKRETTANRFAVRIRTTAAQTEVRTVNTLIPATVQILRGAEHSNGKPLHLIEVTFDLTRVPAHEMVDLPIEIMAREPVQETIHSTSIYVEVETGQLNCWLLLPPGNEYQKYGILRYPLGEASAPETVTPANSFNSMGGSILGFSLLNLKPGFRYECWWERPM